MNVLPLISFCTIEIVDADCWWKGVAKPTEKIHTYTCKPIICTHTHTHMGHADTYVFVWLCLSAIVGTLPRLKQMSFLAAAAEPNTRVSSLVFLSFLVYFAYYNRDLLSAFVVASSQCGHKTWQQSQLLSHKPSERGQTVWTTPVKLIESGRRQAGSNIILIVRHKRSNYLANKCHWSQIHIKMQAQPCPCHCPCPWSMLFQDGYPGVLPLNFAPVSNVNANHKCE